jgi:hypothetical protein
MPDAALFNTPVAFLQFQSMTFSSVKNNILSYNEQILCSLYLCKTQNKDIHACGVPRYDEGSIEAFVTPTKFAKHRITFRSRKLYHAPNLTGIAAESITQLQSNM